MVENPWNVGSFEDFLFYNCPECIFKTKTVKSLVEHAISDHTSNYTKVNQDCASSDCDFTEDEAEKPLWQCQYCDRQFLLQPSLQEHFHQKHSKESSFNCDMCHFKSNVPLVTEQHKQGGYCVNTLPEKQSEEETMEATTSQYRHNALETEDDDHDMDLVNISSVFSGYKDQTLKQYKKTWKEFKRITNFKKDSEPTQEDFAKYLTIKRSEGCSSRTIRTIHAHLNKMCMLIFKKGLSDYPKLKKIVDSHSNLTVKKDSTLEVKSIDDTHKEDNDNKFVCRYCDQKFGFYELLSHRAEVHQLVAEYLCEKCDFECNLPSELQLHQLKKHKKEIDPHIELNQNTITLYPNGFFANQNPSQQPMLEQHELEKQSSTEDEPFESQVGDDDFEMKEEESFDVPYGIQNEIDIHTEDKDTQATFLCDLCSFKCNDIKEYEYHCAALCNYRIIEMEEQTKSKKQETVPEETVLPDKPNDTDLQTDHCYFSQAFNDPIVQQEVEVQTTFTSYFSRKPCNYSCKRCHYRTDSIKDFRYHLVLCRGGGIKQKSEDQIIHLEIDDHGIEMLDKPNEIDLTTDHNYPSYFEKPVIVKQLAGQLPPSNDDQIIEVKLKKNGSEIVKIKKDLKSSHWKNYVAKPVNIESIGIHECYLCKGTIFSNKNSFIQHIVAKHLYAEEHTCLLCPGPEQKYYRFEDYYCLLEHMATLHRMKMVLECYFCPQLFEMPLAMKHHLFTEHKLTGIEVKKRLVKNCELCATAYLKALEKDHMMSVHGVSYVVKLEKEIQNGIAVHRCYLCEEACFTEKGLFIQHLIEQHLFPEQNYQCTLCLDPEVFDGFEDYYHLLEHMVADHDKKMVLECYCCPALFAKPLALKEHLSKIHEVNNINEIRDKVFITCQHCGILIRQCFLKDHLIIRHNIRDSDSENTLDIMQQSDSKITKNKIQDGENKHVKKLDREIEKGFICRVKDCSFSTLERETFKAHLFTHKAFKCNDCWYITFEEENFKDHLLTHKPKIDDVDVQQVYEQVQNMIESTDKQSHKKPGELLKKYFATPTATNRQNPRNYVLGEDVDICDICFKVMKIDRIQAHKENKHKLGNYPCLICDQKFTSRRRLTNHIAKSHPDEKENTTCNFCDKKFKTQAALITHIQRTHSENAIFCPKCPWLSFGSQNMLNRHMRKYHQIIFVCSVCEEMCTSRKGLVQHILEKHGIECSETNFYICPWCREKHSTCDELNHHFHQVHKAPMEHECNKCDKKFSTKLFLTMHTMEVHEFDMDSDSMTNNISIVSALKIKDVKVVEEEVIERKFECSSCGKKLMSQRVLLQHFRQMHQPLTHNHFCHLCSYSTFEKYRLKRHLGEKHDLGEYKCKQCPHISTNLSFHLKHKKTHSGPRRPWKCTECDSAFTIRTKLADHMWIEHGVVFKYNKNIKYKGKGCV